LIVDESGVFLKERGMILDLGGIAKGFAVSQMMQHLQKKGATKALINLGGEILCIGKKYTIGIAHPRENRLLTTITTSKEMTSISTSGDYERYIGDISHHHILDSRSGESNHTCASLTLMTKGDRICELDALATALFNTTPKNWSFIDEDIDYLHLSPELDRWEKGFL
jgi:thiamine biosynthesis lipoprotein